MSDLVTGVILGAVLTNITWLVLGLGPIAMEWVVDRRKR